MILKKIDIVFSEVPHFDDGYEALRLVMLCLLKSLSHYIFCALGTSNTLTDVDHFPNFEYKQIRRALIDNILFHSYKVCIQRLKIKQ